MDIEPLKTELQNQIDIFKNKWEPICKEKYNGDFEKFYQENISNLFNDVKPIWEVCYKMSYKEKYDNLVAVEGIDKMFDGSKE